MKSKSSTSLKKEKTVKNATLYIELQSLTQSGFIISVVIFPREKIILATWTWKKKVDVSFLTEFWFGNSVKIIKSLEDLVIKVLGFYKLLGSLQTIGPARFWSLRLFPGLSSASYAEFTWPLWPSKTSLTEIWLLLVGRPWIPRTFPGAP